MRSTHLLTILALALPLAARAQTALTTPAVADTFVATNGPGFPSSTLDAPNSNFGAAGAMQLTAPGADRGERQSVFRFDLASTVAGFNSTYGVGGWTINTVTLRLASNFSQQGQQPNNPVFNPISSGLFDVRWMADDSWIEGNGTPMGGNTVPGALTFNNLPGFLAAGDVSVGTQSFVAATAPATAPNATYTLALQSNFVADLSSGGLVSLHLVAADSAVSYLFNTRTQGNPPMLTVTAIPEPRALAILALSLAVFALLAGRRRSPRPA